MYTCFYELSIGRIAISEDAGSIVRLYLPNDRLPEGIQLCEPPLLQRAALQLESYLAGERRTFSLPLAPEGTAFMKRIWKSVCEIPYGKTATYKEVAAKIGIPGAARAVGSANGQNPIPLLIPCHRVIGSNGSLTGYRGGLELKRKLLALEKQTVEFLEQDAKK